jgi:hypothetical protein
VKNRATLAAAVAPLTMVPVVAVGAMTLRLSLPQIQAGWAAAGLFASFGLPLAYLVMFTAALPMHRRLQQRQVDSAVPYVALGACCGASPFAIYLAVVAAGLWPVAAGRDGAAFGVMLAVLGGPVGVAVATMFWWMAVRH